VTLGGSNEHFTSEDSVSAYAKYVNGNAVVECGKPCSNLDNAELMMWAKIQDTWQKQWSTKQTMRM